MADLQRRSFVFATPLAVLLSGCGFKLRGKQTFAFETIAVTPEAGGAVATELIRYLGNIVRPVAPLEGQEPPQVILDILQDAREKTIVGFNSTGQVREFQLRLRVRFKLRTPRGREIIPPSEILLQRDISFNETAVLAKEAEEVLLYRDMQADIVQQLLRRLAAVKTIAAPEPVFVPPARNTSTQ
jgi:LPS-assembly lipoprotein